MLSQPAVCAEESTGNTLPTNSIGVLVFRRETPVDPYGVTLAPTMSVSQRDAEGTTPANRRLNPVVEGSPAGADKKSADAMPGCSNTTGPNDWAGARPALARARTSATYHT